MWSNAGSCVALCAECRVFSAVSRIRGPHTLFCIIAARPLQAFREAGGRTFEL